jgi:hypothetical protein
MRKKLITFGIAACLAVPAFAGSASAAPGDNGNGVGGCIDVIYGNNTNPRPSGNGTLPSQSPGPFVNTGVNEPPRNDRVRGVSIGDIHKAAQDLGLNGSDLVAICRASS